MRPDVPVVVMWFLKSLNLQKEVVRLPEKNPNFEMACIFFATHPETWNSLNISADRQKDLTALLNNVRLRAWKHVAEAKWRFALLPEWQNKLTQTLVDYVTICSPVGLPPELRTKDRAKAQAFVRSQYDSKTPPHVSQRNMKAAGFDLQGACLPNFWINKQINELPDADVVFAAKWDSEIFSLPRVPSEDRRTSLEGNFRTNLFNGLKKYGWH